MKFNFFPFSVKMKVDLKLVVLVAVFVLLVVGCSEVSGNRRGGTRITRTSRTIRTVRTVRTVRTTRTIRTTRRQITARTPRPITSRTSRPIFWGTTRPTTWRNIPVRTSTRNTRRTSWPTFRGTTRPTMWRNTTPRKSYRSTMSWRSYPFSRTTISPIMSSTYPFGWQSRRPMTPWKKSTIFPTNGKMKTKYPTGWWKPKSIDCVHYCDERDSCRHVNQCYRLYGCPERCGGIRNGVSWITIVVVLASCTMTLIMIK